MIKNSTQGRMVGSCQLQNGKIGMFKYIFTFLFDQVVKKRNSRRTTTHEVQENIVFHYHLYNEKFSLLLEIVIIGMKNEKYFFKLTRIYLIFSVV